MSLASQLEPLRFVWCAGVSVAIFGLPPGRKKNKTEIHSLRVIVVIMDDKDQSQRLSGTAQSRSGTPLQQKASICEHL